MTYLDCRQQMHFAEHLARVGASPSAPDLAKIEGAYVSPVCEPKIARRLGAALDLIEA